MMTNREMLELAAKAAGIDCLIWHDNANAYWIQYGERCYWNPLEDDGDALRLVVKLGMVVDVRYKQPEALKYNRVTFWNTPSRGEDVVFEDVEINPLAATRRAIVRAAAQIGARCNGSITKQNQLQPVARSVN